MFCSGVNCWKLNSSHWLPFYLAVVVTCKQIVGSVWLDVCVTSGSVLVMLFIDWTVLMCWAWKATNPMIFHVIFAALRTAWLLPFCDGLPASKLLIPLCIFTSFLLITSMIYSWISFTGPCMLTNSLHSYTSNECLSCHVAYTTVLFILNIFIATFLWYWVIPGVSKRLLYTARSDLLHSLFLPFSFLSVCLSVCLSVTWCCCLQEKSLRLLMPPAYMT
jgi:hypothetical protein